MLLPVMMINPGYDDNYSGGDNDGDDGTNEGHQDTI